MCISVRHTLKEELKNIQMKSKQILLKQEKKQKNLEKTLKRVQVRRTCDQSAFRQTVLYSWKQVNTHNMRETGGGEKRRGRLRERLCSHHWLPPEKFPISEGADRSSRGGGSSSGSELPTDPAGEDGGNEEEERWAGASSTDGQRCPFLGGIVWSHLQKLYLNPYDRWCLHFLWLFSLSPQEWPSLKRRCEKDLHHPLGSVSEDPLLPFEFTKSAVDELGRQLKEFCDQKFTSISQSGMCLCWHVELLP